MRRSSRRILCRAVAPNGGRGRLVFENVSFSYSPDKPLITDLSLVAEPGQTVAIVGPPGRGRPRW